MSYRKSRTPDSLMLSFVSANRRRSIAAFVLLGWLMILFVGIAHACVPAPSSYQSMSDDAPASASGHAACVHEDSEHDGSACRIACDAQTSNLAKEKSFDASGPGSLISFISAYIVPLLPSAAFMPGAPGYYSGLHDAGRFLRFARLTL